MEGAQKSLDNLMKVFMLIVTSAGKVDNGIYIYVLLHYIVVEGSSLKFKTILSLLIHLSVCLDVSL